MRPRARRVAVPACRDPFINCLLTPVRPAPEVPERFWISTWNTVDGCTGALVDENGGHRLYRFREPRRPGFYSVAPGGGDTLWLWGNLEETVRLSLRTGRYECFLTGAPSGLVFHGMALDPGTEKLLAAANTKAGPTVVSFDTRRRATARIYNRVAPDCYLRGHFANGDGTWTLVTECPGTSLLHWDPVAETIRAERLRDDYRVYGEAAGAEVSWQRLVQDEDGLVYFPHRGWYDPRKRSFVARCPRPEREMTWFARCGEFIVGTSYSDGDTIVGLWERASGRVSETARLPDCPWENVNLAASGKLVAVSMYGEFTRRDLHTGRLEISRLLPAAGVQHTDCLRLVGRDRLLGTPFITQRFWEVNLRTGRGFDCGRAAPGAGEILQTWRLGGKVYMAAYSGGKLVEYDPEVHPHFPENPRVVANPPASNRPVAAADDGRRLYYACSAHYGRLGSTLTCYDTVAGTSSSAVNPIPGQRIVSLAYDRRLRRLLAATHFDADSASCPPAGRECFFASLSADSLGLLERLAAPPGTASASILGPLRAGRWLCRLAGDFPGSGAADLLLELGGDPLKISPLDGARPVPPGWGTICSFGGPGRFAVQAGARVESWDLAAFRRLEIIYRRGAGRRLLADGETLFLLGKRDILVLSGAARGRTPVGGSKPSGKGLAPTLR